MGISEGFYDLFSLSFLTEQTRFFTHTLTLTVFFVHSVIFIHLQSSRQTSWLRLPPVINYLYFYLFID